LSRDNAAGQASAAQPPGGNAEVNAAAPTVIVPLTLILWPDGAGSRYRSGVRRHWLRCPCRVYWPASEARQGPERDRGDDGGIAENPVVDIHLCAVSDRGDDGRQCSSGAGPRSSWPFLTCLDDGADARRSWLITDETTS
jgi:hypothetical protein